MIKFYVNLTCLPGKIPSLSSSGLNPKNHQLCKDLQYAVEITDITQEMLLAADEAFFTGSATEITPIATVDDTPIANGQPGTITLKLKELYSRVIHGKESHYNSWLTFVNSPIENKKIILQESDQ